jgi:hypothetical protein
MSSSWRVEGVVDAASPQSWHAMAGRASVSRERLSGVEKTDTS